MTMSALTPSTAPEAGEFPDYSAYLHVAAAVIEDNAGRILLARRPKHLHQGGLWEFPGGKVEPDETVAEALGRELQEELGIQVRHSSPLIRIPYHYPDRKVLLDVWRVTVFNNEPYGAEGQEVRWVESNRLPDYPFPAANAPIVTAAMLPDRYLITPEPGEPELWPEFLSGLEQAIDNGIQLIQFRSKLLCDAHYQRLAHEVIALGKRANVRTLLNAPPEVAFGLKADGVHLTSARLMALEQRPLDETFMVAASCHNLAQLRHAMVIGADFAVVSPVGVTASHPGAAALGWDGFRLMTEHAGIPVFALGGMSESDLASAGKHGGQGIAAIRALWPKNSEGQ